MNPYASNKAVLHMDRLLALRAGKQPVPVHVHFIISDLCNQDCSFCAYRIEGYTERFAVIEDGGIKNHNPNRMIPQLKAQEILEDLAEMGVRAVQFTGGGEPTVHPNCAVLLRYARNLGMEIALVTNGVKLEEPVRRVLMDATWTRISLDAGNEDTYARMRRVPVGHWHRVLKNVEQLVRERDGELSELTIGIGFVVNQDNWREVFDCAKLARDLGVDNMRISAAFQPDNAVYFRGFHRQAADLCHDATLLSTDRFKVINNFGSRFADLELAHPEYDFCPHQHLVTYIGADLNVYRCCVTSYTERGLVGSIADRRFRELWESEHKQAAMEGFDARGCPRCQFNDKNRAINGLIGQIPPHGAFL